MQAQLAINLTQLINKSGDNTPESIRKLLDDSQSIEERLNRGGSEKLNKPLSGKPTAKIQNELVRNHIIFLFFQNF